MKKTVVRSEQHVWSQTRLLRVTFGFLHSSCAALVLDLQSLHSYRIAHAVFHVNTTTVTTRISTVWFAAAEDIRCRNAAGDL